MKKERVDILLVQQKLFETREQAKRGVMAGLVYDENNQRYDKPGEKVSSEKLFHLKGESNRYVSRGGLKLEKALEVFDIHFENKNLLDIGSSTGGFTDVALQNGARLSYALDVGYNQLSWKLRQDSRVVVMERTNFRYSEPADFTEGIPEIATIDVSFISLKLILPVLKKILADGGDVVALIKPQFEAGKELVGKKGIVRDKTVHRNVINEIIHFANSEGYSIQQVDYSPITGGEGNIEFLLHLNWQAGNQINHVTLDTVEDIVNEAHQQLKK